VPGSYPLSFDVDYPTKLSRLGTLFRLVLAIPQLLIIYALGTVVGIITFIAWFAILFTRRYPKGLFELVVSFNRWIANVYAYMALLRDEYPPFSTDPGRYSVTYDVDYPEKLSRWLIFVKWYLVLLHQIVLDFLGFVAILADIIAYFAILITGRFPRALFNYIVGVMRWNFRVTAYSSLMRDEFPPYSMRADAKAGSGRAIAVTAVLVIPAAIVLIAALVGIVLLVGTITSSTETVRVRYADILAGESTAPVDIEGNSVVLLSGEDPFDVPGVFREPRAGYRFVQFELEIRNLDSAFTSVTRQHFGLKDSQGRQQDPLLVQAPPLDRGQIERGQTERIGVVFEVRNDADPSELTYAPGFAAFVPFGEKVRFEFTGIRSRAPASGRTTPSPVASPRTYDIAVAVDSGSAAPGWGHVDVGGLTIGPTEVEDPHPQAGRARLPNRPARSGARYFLVLLQITIREGPTVIIEQTNFHLRDTVGSIHEPDLLTFGGSAGTRLALVAHPPGTTGTLAGLVFELDNGTSPSELTYEPAFADTVAGGSETVHVEFR